MPKSNEKRIKKKRTLINKIMENYESTSNYRKIRHT
jgi:hypothetical protein